MCNPMIKVDGKQLCDECGKEFGRDEAGDASERIYSKVAWIFKIG